MPRVYGSRGRFGDVARPAKVAAMMRRALALVGGLAGAAVLSQYPAFNQQYLQRLAGQVDALTVVVTDFDSSALASGLGRHEALTQMTGTAFLDARASDMRATFLRHAQLSDHLAVLRDATPLQRIAMPHRMADPTTLTAAWSDFEPALPLSAPGAVTAGAGFVTGWAGVAALLALITAPFRRKRGRPTRREPGVARTTPTAQSHVPKLQGVRR